MEHPGCKFTTVRSQYPMICLSEVEDTMEKKCASLPTNSTRNYWRNVSSGQPTISGDPGLPPLVYGSGDNKGEKGV